MAKDLPYFKFFCSEWNDGNITLEDYKIQGLFINICSYYWSNECDVKLKILKKKFKSNIDDIDYLIKEGLIKGKDDYISISFLDEQCIERGKLSNTNSKNAKSRWDKVRDECDRNATASNSQSESDAIKKRKENKRKEKNVNNFDSIEYKNELWDYLLEYCQKNNLDVKKVKNEALKAYEYYKELGWKNSNNKKIINLKSTIRNNWLSDLSKFSKDAKAWDW